MRYLKGARLESYPVDSVIYLSNNWALDRMRRRGWHIRVKLFKTVVNASQWINHYPVYNALGFPNFYPLDSNLSSGQRYPTFEQLLFDCITRDL